MKPSTVKICRMSSLPALVHGRTIVPTQRLCAVWTLHHRVRGRETFVLRFLLRHIRYVCSFFFFFASRSTCTIQNGLYHKADLAVVVVGCNWWSVHVLFFFLWIRYRAFDRREHVNELPLFTSLIFHSFYFLSCLVVCRSSGFFNENRCYKGIS